MSDQKVFHLEICPVCNQKGFSNFLHSNDWLISKEDFTIVSCDSCGFQFTQDAPKESLIGSYYDDVNYIEHSDSNKGFIFGVYHYARKLMVNRKRRLIKRYTKGKNILDIGSGSGYFLDHLVKSGYTAEGIEKSPSARAKSKELFGVDSSSDDDFLAGKWNDKFDCISMWHVLEHVYPIEKYLELIKQSLKKDGVFVTAMPNPNCHEAKFYKEYWNGFDVPRHLWHFRPKDFEKLANRCGFELIQKHQLHLDPFYNSMVSNDYLPSKHNFITVLFVGLKSLLKGMSNVNNASSVVYVLRANNN